MPSEEAFNEFVAARGAALMRTAYLLTDKHAKGKDTVSKYVSKDYRASIKATNKAAAKFADTPDKELLEDIKAFLIKGAKDGDAPASCS